MGANGKILIARLHGKPAAVIGGDTQEFRIFGDIIIDIECVKRHLRILFEVILLHIAPQEVLGLEGKPFAGEGFILVIALLLRCRRGRNRHLAALDKRTGSQHRQSRRHGCQLHDQAQPDPAGKTTPSDVLSHEFISSGFVYLIRNRQIQCSRSQRASDSPP